MKRRLYLAACLLGLVICSVKLAPLEDFLVDWLPGDYVLIGITALCLYLAGYCFYRIGLAINVYFTYSDFQ